MYIMQEVPIGTGDARQEQVDEGKRRYPPLVSAQNARDL